jgi:hypothetical protein
MALRRRSSSVGILRGRAVDVSMRKEVQSHLDVADHHVVALLMSPFLMTDAFLLR